MSCGQPRNFVTDLTSSATAMISVSLRTGASATIFRSTMLPSLATFQVSPCTSPLTSASPVPRLAAMVETEVSPLTGSAAKATPAVSASIIRWTRTAGGEASSEAPVESR